MGLTLRDAWVLRRLACHHCRCNSDKALEPVVAQLELRQTTDRATLPCRWGRGLVRGSERAGMTARGGTKVPLLIWRSKFSWYALYAYKYGLLTDPLCPMRICLLIRPAGDRVGPFSTDQMVDWLLGGKPPKGINKQQAQQTAQNPPALAFAGILSSDYLARRHRDYLAKSGEVGGC